MSPVTCGLPLGLPLVMERRFQLQGADQQKAQMPSPCRVRLDSVFGTFVALIIETIKSTILVWLVLPG